MRRLVNLILIGLLLAGTSWAWRHLNDISDWFYFRSYQPPLQIQQLAADAAMSSYGQRLFFRSGPNIDPDRASLAADCHIPNGKIVELGCYDSRQRIYLLNLGSAELKDEMRVTAAHEMLHAAYIRMSPAEKQRINALVEQAAAQTKDPHLAEELQNYAETEPTERDNELHSLLGTEIAPLPPELERYYSKYFTDRLKVVNQNRQFNQVFDGLKNSIDSQRLQIDSLKRQMNANLRAGNITAYNALVPRINSVISQYNNNVTRYNLLARDVLGEETPQPEQ